jgi:hypothetical protein
MGQSFSATAAEMALARSVFEHGPGKYEQPGRIAGSAMERREVDVPFLGLSHEHDPREDG